ncbi:MAG: hypothetical protein HYY30_10575 [Chloroflexi bacterium]|nr:hypothetical protein [Chloroflexota bacterium]
MNHKLLGERLERIRQIAENYLRANGYEIVTEDKKLFPYVEPALAALKQGRLLVFAMVEFPSAEQFLRPEELIHVRDDLEQFITENTPVSDGRVNRVDRVALVMCPEDINVLSPVGDIKWLIVQGEDQVPEEIDRLSP